MQSINKWGVSDQAPKAQIRIIGAKVKGTKVGTTVTTTVRVIMSEMVTTIATTTSTGVTTVTEMIVMGPMSLLKIVMLLLGMVEIVWRELRICLSRPKPGCDWHPHLPSYVNEPTSLNLNISMKK